jgi:DNA-binding LacI/PurR family transcriptional regulator
MRSRRSRPTLSDIAAEAGISTATVSKVLNGHRRSGQPLEEMGRTAARTLFPLDGELLVSPRMEPTTELRVRLSTAPPPA